MDRRPVIGMNMRISSARGRSDVCIPARYLESVIAAGGRPLLVPPTQDEDLLGDYVQMADAFLFIGGRDYPPDFYGEPAHDRIEPLSPLESASDLALGRLVIKSELPVLGICGGHQLISILCGGKLVAHLPTAKDHEADKKLHADKQHTIEIGGGKILSGLFGTGEIVVNSSHHQAVNHNALGGGLVAAAYAPDGTLEALESASNRFVLGVQWHPERIDDPEHNRKVFGAFLDAARRGVGKRRVMG